MAAGEVETARPAQYGELPAAAAGVFGCGVLAVHFDGLQRIAFVAACGLPLLWMYYIVFVRLHFSPSSMAVQVGPYRKMVNLDRLVDVGYRPTGYVAVLTLRDSAGGVCKIQLRRFGRDREWAEVLLNAVDRTGATIDPRAHRSLSHADGTGRGWIA